MLLLLGASEERKDAEKFRFQSPADNAAVWTEHFVIKLTVRPQSNSKPQVREGF
jgi:hypothetical protein